MMKQRLVKKNPRGNMTNRKTINVELETKCSCTPFATAGDATIQFTRRYLQCASAMPIRVLRLLIETILPHSSAIKVSIFDCNERLLKDSDRLYSLKSSYASANHLALRFTLLNTVTSLPHCSCLSPPIDDDLSPRSATIERERIDQILSTCSIAQSTLALASCLSPPGSPMVICPPYGSGFLIDSDPDELTVDLITSEFGEVCSPLSELPYQENLLTSPLDLSLKSKSNLSKSTFLSDSLCDTSFSLLNNSDHRASAD